MALSAASAWIFSRLRPLSTCVFRDWMEPIRRMDPTSSGASDALATRRPDEACCDACAIWRCVWLVLARKASADGERLEIMSGLLYEIDGFLRELIEHGDKPGVRLIRPLELDQDGGFFIQADARVLLAQVLRLSHQRFLDLFGILGIRQLAARAGG